jgi:hypothetical protein
MKYKIVSAINPLNLTEEVNSFIKKGWEPQGGLTMVPSQGATTYIQAMVFLTPDNNENSKYFQVLAKKVGFSQFGNGTLSEQIALDKFSNFILQDFKDLLLNNSKSNQLNISVSDMIALIDKHFGVK